MDRNQFLRPMGLGELLDSTVRLYKKNFLLLVTAQLPLAVFYLLQNAYSYSASGGQDSITELYQMFTDPFAYQVQQQFAPTPSPWYSTIIILLSFLQIAIIYPVTLSAVTKVASDSVLEGTADVKNAYRFSLRNWFRLGVTNVFITIALTIALLLAMIIPVTAAIAVVAFTLSTGSAGELIVGVIVIVVSIGIGAFIGGFAWVRLSATYPIMVNEKIFIVEAMTRSWNMVKGHTFRIYAALIIIFLIPSVIQLTSFFAEFLMKGSLVVMTIALGLVAQGLLIPMADCARVLIYFDLRTRKEGYDLEMRTQQLSQPVL
ncbi:MAG: hypothetical protein HXS41_00380 [Theionarchaea archaeon]|nr:hypothetical protein [Theionarchaea archaeon]MBU7019487.1 hypothetical protein [Theionarchaea archaeon]MBU7041723.1 hypothetical protein [Theionarchaea archaeon]